MPRAYRVPNTALDKIPRPPATINAHSGTVAQAASSNTFLAYRRGHQRSRQNTCVARRAANLKTLFIMP
jgi:hypothetical protein